MFSRVPRPAIFALILAVILLVTASSLFAAAVGRIKGIVTDTKTGEPLFGVSVQIEGTTMGAKTDIDGNYIVISVPPKVYNLKVTLLSYEPVLVEDVQVNTDQTSEINIQMKQTVIETGKVTVVKGTRKGIDINVTGTVSIKTQKEIQVAPVASVDDLLSRETGITRDAEGELHIRGGRSGETTYLVDGVNYSDPLGGRAPVDAGINISSSAVLELQVIKDGFDPEYGEALSGVVKITSPSGSPEKTRSRIEYYTDDFGAENLNKYSENLDQLEFSISGPDPVLTSRILPALGISYFEDKDFTFYLYSRAVKDDTRNPYSRYNTSATRKTYSGVDILGIHIPDRQNNLYNLDFTLAFDPTSNIKVKALYKGSWRHETDFTWVYRYTPATAPIYDYSTNTVSLQLKQVLSKSTDYEINLSYWGSRYVQKPGDPEHPGEGLDPDQMLFIDEYETYDDLNGNNQFDESEPFINIFPDSVSWGSIYVPLRNGADVWVSEDAQIGGYWYPFFDLNNNGIMDQFEGEPFADLNGNGVWDIGDRVTRDVNGNNTFDNEYRDVTTPFITSREEPYIDGDSSLGEPFTDINGNGVYDPGVDRFVTALNTPPNQDFNRDNKYTGPGRYYWEPGIPYIDYNGNGVYDAPNNAYDPGEPFVDINKNGRHDQGGDNNTAFLLYGFEQSGDGNIWTEEKVDKYTVKGNFKKAIGRAHEIKAGLEFRRENISVAAIQGLQQYSNEPDSFPLNTYPYFGRGTIRDFYEREPKVLVMYFRDKIEYGSLVASLGLRADLFFQSDLKGVSTVQDRTGHELTDIRNKFSPRVSINYPISERAMIRFNYGHFYELPNYNYMYRNANPLGSGSVNLVGNPNLDYTKTVNYTFGVNFAFTDEYSMKLSGFYKDYFDIIATSVYGQGASAFSYYDNTDYARVRGVEVELERKASRFVNGTLSYEYSFAYGKSSSDSENYERLLAQDEISIDENPLDWDIRHRVGLWLQFYFTDRDHPRLFGISIPNDWDMSIYWRFQTGFPFTPDKSFPGMTLDVGEKPLKNSMRLPSTAFTDIKLHKRFRISGMEWTFKVWIKNLFDNKNVLAVYSTTGRPDTGNNQSGIIGGGTERQANPSYWGRGRQIILGLALQF
jgi:outer membrane receptor protein involved in Fe transport